MFKRMSILARRAGDDRAYFARRWRAHGDFIVRLPGLRGYIQNHVVDEVNPPGIAVDGIVELWFDTPEAMAEAFRSEVATAMRDDEPAFLGRATGYGLAGGPEAPGESATGRKLFLIERDDERSGPSLLGAVPDITWRAQDVSSLIAKPGQSEPPVPVERFIEVTATTSEPLAATLQRARKDLHPSCALFEVTAIRLL